MSKRKKLSKYEKQQRRIEEIRRANERISGAFTQPVSSGQGISGSPTSDLHKVSSESELRFTLPVNEIKRDLKVNIMYLVFCAAVLIGLFYADITITQVFSF